MLTPRVQPEAICASKDQLTLKRRPAFDLKDDRTQRSSREAMLAAFESEAHIADMIEVIRLVSLTHEPWNGTEH